MRDQKKWVRAREMAKDAAKRMAEGSSLVQTAGALKLANQELGPFSRVNPPLPNPQLIGAAFGLKQGEHSQPLDTEEGIYLLEVLEHTPADSAAFARELDQLRVAALRQERQARIQSYMISLREQADVKDYRSEIYRTTAQAEAEAERVRQQTGQPQM